MIGHRVQFTLHFRRQRRGECTERSGKGERVGGETEWRGEREGDVGKERRVAWVPCKGWYGRSNGKEGRKGVRDLSFMGTPLLLASRNEH